MSDGERLALVVDRERAQRVIDRLRARDRYDDARGVESYGEDRVAVPVTEPPEVAGETVQQVGERRLRDLPDHLHERGWTDAEIERAPASWAVIGSVVLVDAGDWPRPEEVGEALLDLHGSADTVLVRNGITGAHREPNVEVLAGAGDTETVHREHGTRYALDLAAVMFSPGNKAERARMGEVVDAEERVLDMFAGIGHFTLPMARAGADVTAVERNPTAFRYLVENARLNGVSDRVHPYRADCRDVIREAFAPRAGTAPEAPVDRIVMGYYDATEPAGEAGDGEGTDGESPSGDGDAGEGYTYLDPALDALAPGGVVHVHEATPEPLAFDRPIGRIRDAAGERDVAILDAREVKGYSEGVVHTVVDARIG